MKADLINVIDLEATCWKGSPPKGQVQEIIEVGIVVLDVPNLEIVEEEAILIRPTSSVVSEFCTELTTLTQEDLDGDGITLELALEKLAKDYRAGNRLYATWGNWDVGMFARDAKNKGLRNPFGKTSHLNAKELFSLAKGFKNLKGLGKACSIEGLEFEGTAHRGVDDARMIARVLIEVFKNSR